MELAGTGVKVAAIASRIAHYGFQTLSIEIVDVLRIWQLETHHKDPFDRLLIAQSQRHNLPILTADSKFSLYNVTVIW